MSQRHTILIVDDNPRNVQILTKILRHDYGLATASSGEEAIEVASGAHADLVLLDIMMPGIDGYETCRRLRADARFPWLKIIMVSAKAMASERLSGYEAGADDYITKPFDEDELLAKVRVHLRLKSMEEVDRLKTDVLAILSHETRTPLQLLMGPAAILMGDEEMSIPDRRQWAQIIHRGALRLQRLYDNIFMLTQLKAGDVAVRQDRVDVCSVAQEALSAATPRASAREVTVEAQLIGPALALLDTELMTMAVATLLDNAIRFSRPRGTVVVAASQQEQTVRLSVQDHGIGMKEAFLPRIFNEFAIADVDHHEGNGLSLAIARRIVIAHGGEISVQSREGEGSTFTIELPGAPAGADGAAADGASS